MPAGAVAADVAAATASFAATNVSCRDSGFVLNGIAQGPWLPANVSWDMQWSGPTGHSKLRDSTNRFDLDAVETNCTIDWSADGPEGFSFKADPASSNSVYALVGKERNGVFF
jgi:hypothetical protein